MRPRVATTDSYMQSAGLTETRFYPPIKTLLNPPNSDIKTNARILYIACCGAFFIFIHLVMSQLDSYLQFLLSAMM